MAAVPQESDLEHRRCPSCGTDASVVVAEERIERSKLDRFAFASRKPPEYMHYRLVRCEACDLVYASPAPTAKALDGAYRDAAFDAGDESAFASATYASFLSGILPNLPSVGGALDIGTGDGAFLAALLRSGFTDVVGVEPSAAPVAAASDAVRPLIRQGPFRAEDFHAGRFRLVTSFQTLEHLSDPLATCSSAYNLLVPGGALFVVCHDRRATANRLLGRRSPIYDVEHLQLFTARSLGALLERAGFQAIDVRPVVNRYPVRYWFRLLPLPGPVRRAGARILRSRLGGAALSLPVGNMAAVGYKPA